MIQNGGLDIVNLHETRCRSTPNTSHSGSSFGNESQCWRNRDLVPQWRYFASFRRDTLPVGGPDFLSSLARTENQAKRRLFNSASSRFSAGSDRARLRSHCSLKDVTLIALGDVQADKQCAMLPATDASAQEREHVCGAAPLQR